MLKFENVTKKYPDGKIALQELNLEIADGEFVFIVGPSGAGKSTLLKLITRETMPTTGRILLDDQDIATIKPSKIPQLRRKIGTVFQDFKLLLSRTVAENVAIPLEVLSQKDSHTQKRVMEVLEKVGLEEKANR